MPRHRIDLTNQRFNKLLVLKFSHSDKLKQSYWECLCDCGKIKVIRAPDFKSGETVSCGCYFKEALKKRNWKNKLPPGEAAFNQIYRNYKRAALRRNIKFDLLKEDFKKLTQQNCYYCNIKPKRIFKLHKSTYIYNGVDRVNNNL